MVIPLIIKLSDSDEGGAVNIPTENIWNDITTNATNLTNVRLTQESGNEVKINVKSIPSPFARMILFRNAFNERYHFPPVMKEEIFEDILDTMEFLFLIKSTSFYDKMKVEKIDLRDVNSIGTILNAQKNYLEVLKSFSETYLDREEKKKYEILTLIHFPSSETDSDSILCGSSPFTIFFTPERINLHLPGFFERRLDNHGKRIFKTFSERNKEFLKFLISFNDTLPISTREFRVFFQNKLDLERLPLNDIRISESDFDYSRDIYIFPEVRFPIYNKTVDISSFYLLRPKISSVNNSGEIEKYPMILTKKVRNNIYYDNTLFPDNWESVLDNSLINDPERKREVLPGTTKTYPWIYPETDFFEDKLIKLPHKLDSYKMYDGDNRDLSNFHYLIPLKEKFFKYFKPEDIETYLKYEIINPSNDHIGTDEVNVILEIPINGRSNYPEKLVIKKTYNSKSINYSCFTQDRLSKKIGKQGVYIAIWPTILDQEENKRIERYYILQFQKDLKNSDNWLETTFYYYRNNRLLKSINDNRSDENTDLIHCVDRNEQTKIFSLKYAPEIIQLETIDHIKGVLLPKYMTKLDRNYYTQDSLTVGIDFGTSNTVVAFKRSNTETTDILKIKKGDLFYTKIYDEESNEDRTDEGIKQFNKVLNTFFIPLSYEDRYGNGKPFSTEVCYVSPLNGENAILHSNITFAREIPGDNGNLIKSNLKWATDESENVKLVKMFFAELKCLIQKYAIENRIDINRISYRFSYPLAFTANQQARLMNVFRLNMVTENHEANNLISSDESICSQKYFTYLEKNKEAFAIANVTPVVTVDIGGGTSDIVGYSNNKLLFKNSILFGGQNLFVDIIPDGTITNPFVLELKAFLKKKMETSSHLREIYSDDIFNKYKDSHSLFSYIVSKEQFSDLETDINSEGFNDYFKLILLYFYSTIVFFIGLNIKKYYEENGMNIHNIGRANIAFGGNSSRFLSWICHFMKWDAFGESSSLHNYSAFFQEIFFHAIGTNVENFTIIQSSSPKEEVIKGLLHDDIHAEEIGRGERGNNLLSGEELVGDITMSKLEYINEKITSKNYANIRFKDFSTTNIELLNNEFLKSVDKLDKQKLFNKKHIVNNFKTTLNNLTEQELLNEINKIIQGFYAKPINKNEAYNESYLITAAKACLNYMMKNIKIKE